MRNPDGLSHLAVLGCCLFLWGWTGERPTHPLASNPRVWIQKKEVTATDPKVRGFFGREVALEGKTALVGGGQTDQVAVLVDGPSGWERRETLSDPELSDFQGFGPTVAYDGDTALVGVLPHDPEEAEALSSVYVFSRSAGVWSQSQQLTASDGASGDVFGGRIAIDGDTAVVTALRDDHHDLDKAGSAYVFTRDGKTWTEQQKLTASDATRDHGFGVSVAVDGDTILVGAYREDAGQALLAGSVYVFVRRDDSWVEAQQLTASKRKNGAQFGSSVDLAGDLAVVGAHTESDQGWKEGAAFIARRRDGEWSVEQRLLAEEGNAEDFFGTSVAIGDGVALIGANDHDSDEIDTGGAVYSFEYTGDTWQQTQTIIPDDEEAILWFGDALAMDGRRAIVGTPGSRETYRLAGSAYMLERDTDGDGDGIADTNDNCPSAPNRDQADPDDDGAGTACDQCPEDAQKTAPGECGCDSLDTDFDANGVVDCRESDADAGGELDTGIDTGDGSRADTSPYGSDSGSTDGGRATDVTDNGCGVGTPERPLGGWWLLLALFAFLLTHGNNSNNAFPKFFPSRS